MSTILDAFALIALMREEPAADQVEALLRAGDVAITAVNLAEALDVLQRIQGISRERLEEVTVPLVAERIKLIPTDERIARDAADIRARRYHRTRSPLSLADCVLLATAGPSDPIATADAPLIRVAEAENIKINALPH
ncbi:MAG TPA: PIN domain-containing protein [Solirubrobacteraceae bacterium]|nr:PIN domain-containing protein [Solirubrobacteraceae bacterium]